VRTDSPTSRGGTEDAALPRFGWAEILLLVLAAILFVVAVDWGIHSGGAQAPDEIDPEDVRIAESHHFSNGWAKRYPPFFYYVLSAAYSVGEHLGVEPATSSRAHFLIGRAISLLAMLGTTLIVVRLGRRLGSRTAGLVAGLLWLSSPTVVYYAKTANVEALYLVLLSASLWLLVRFRDEGRHRLLVGAGAVAVLAVATKDQAAAFVSSMPFLALAAIAERERAAGASPRRAVGRALLSPGAWTTLVVSLLLGLLVYNLPSNWEGFRRHLKIISGPHWRYVEHASDLAGRLDLALETLRNLVFVVGLPGILLTIAGAVVVTRTPRLRSRHREHLACSVVYLAILWAFVPWNYDRFVLPAAISAVLLAGIGWERVVAPRLSGRVRAIVLTTLGLFCTARAVELDLRLVFDSRRLVGEWIETDGGGFESTWVLAPTSWSPIVGARIQTGLPPYLRRQLRRYRPRHLVLDASLLNAPQWNRLFEEEDYREAWRSAGPIPPRLTVMTGARTNLDKISPELVVLRRGAS